MRGCAWQQRDANIEEEAVSSFGRCFNKSDVERHVSGVSADEITGAQPGTGGVSEVSHFARQLEMLSQASACRAVVSSRTASCTLHFQASGQSTSLQP